MAQDDESNDLVVLKCNIHLPDSSMFSLSITPNETVETLVVTFLEYNETYCYTSFGFKLMTDGEDGELLNDYLEIGNYLLETPDAAPVIELKVVLLDYTVKKIRDHVRRTRDFITSSSNIRQSIHDVVVDSNAGEAGEEEKKGDSVPESNSVDSKKDAKKAKEEKEKKEKELENGKDLTNGLLTSVKTPVVMSRFFDELLMRHASKESKSSPSTNNSIDDSNAEKRAPKMFEAVKSIMESGWSPPSAARRMHGDMLYLEVVTATEGVLHITCTSKGFFVNRSSRNFFDPRPSASNPGFSHSLFDTLYSVLPTFRKSVLQNKEKKSGEGHDSSEAVKNDKALDSLMSLYTTAEPSDVSLTPGTLQWNTPPTSMIASKDNTNTAYDMSRTQESILGPLAKMSIMEEKGPPREWNEDLQVARSISRESRESRLFQAKLLAKTIADFEMVCKHTVVDIVEGNISPYNPVDSEQSQVFLYQGVFFSGAVDQKESFRISEGDVASRKYAAHDLDNQKRILSFDIDGLCHVLQMIVDYKGRRFIAQNIIPGILNPSGSVAGATRLLYGTLDQGNRMKCKTNALKMMEEVASKFYLPKRTIPARLPSDGVTADAARNPAEDAMATQAAALGVEMTANAVREDEEDEAVPVDSENIPHYGPIEFKLIEGSDKRIYALEACRLTPRDANYVSISGTSMIRDDLLTKHVDGNIAKAYLLRHELVESYMNHKFEMKRNEIITRYTKDVALDEAEDKDTVPESVAVTKSSGNTDATEGEEEAAAAAESEADIAKKEAKAKAEKEKLERRTKAMLEANKELQALSKEKVNEGFVLNPNVFFDERVVADTDPAVVKKDEEIVRELSKFLYESVLPSISRSVRKGESNPLDNAAMVNILHSQGVNMRYLGRLAHIAREEEMDDYATMLGPAVPIYSMPKYWRNMIETEIVARCVKIYVNQLFAESGDMKDAPAATIASILNILLVSDADQETSADVQDDNKSKADQSQISSATDSKSKKKKNKKSKVKNAKTENEESNESVSVPPIAYNAISDKAQVIKSIDEIMKSRFLYSFGDLLSTCKSDYEQYHPQKGAKKEEIDGKAAKTVEMELTEEQQKQKDAKTRILLKENGTDVDSICNTPLGDRLSRLSVLRRICQVIGLRVITKDYDFKATASSHDLSKGVFSTDDIMGLVPLFKSCEPTVPMKDIGELMIESQNLMQTADVRGAFSKAQDAHNLIMQVAGPSHRIAVDTQELLSNIFMNVGDLKPAIELHQKSMATLVTLEGLDSNRVVLGHITLAQLHISMKDFPQAINHFRSALYSIALMGGRDHPVNANIYQKIAEVFMVYPISETGELRESADLNFCLRLFDAARSMSSGLPTKAMLGISVADIFKAVNMYTEALTELKNSHAILSEIFGEGDQRTEHLKQEILGLRRKVTEIGVLRARKAQQDEERK